MRMQTRGLLAVMMLVAVSAAAMPGGNGNGHGNGNGGNGNGNGSGSPNACDPTALTAIHDAIMTACPCDTAGNHGRFVSCASHVLLQATRDGALDRACRHLARRGVSRSSCGKTGFVTCCRAGAPGAAACTVKRTAAICVAVGGCVGSTSTCIDACATSCASPSGAFLDAGGLF